MTKPRYLIGCAAGSEVCEVMSPYAGDADNAWNVNFNNGNSNWNNRNNDNYVRAVRASECQGVTLQELHTAWKAARVGKIPSTNQLGFDSQWTDGLAQLQCQLNAGTWRPAKSICFIATKPKAREIHAPDFSDRVVHHWLVPQLERVWEPIFIHDSYANRKGKGSHAAVRRLREFVCEVHSGQGGGYYLQLDIANFFNSIHRPKLWKILKPRMIKAGLSVAAQRACHALLAHPISEVDYRCTRSERAMVPTHKRLEAAAPGCGLPIGNLSSQFLANVYMNELDQFIKHELKAGRYLRYVDDFVLVHHDREQLQSWLVRIEEFLKSRLQLSLKTDIKLRPLTAGVDFLGYFMFPTHTLVRRRVVSHAREKLSFIERTGLRSRDEARSVWASYQGHFLHANSFRLRRDFHKRYPWLKEIA